MATSVQVHTDVIQMRNYRIYLHNIYLDGRIHSFENLGDRMLYMVGNSYTWIKRNPSNIYNITQFTVSFNQNFTPDHEDIEMLIHLFLSVYVTKMYISYGYNDGILLDKESQTETQIRNRLNIMETLEDFIVNTILVTCSPEAWNYKTLYPLYYNQEQPPPFSSTIDYIPPEYNQEQPPPYL